ncbi:hypothetical protein ACFDR9_000767 [Janthinobacterium sp. CG_23.3]|uniref:DUF3619 family protein n=1 Tax=unclassified Janthinobacterium TaxID=2610881 RepID=UPI000346E54E|nr:MULTISPECIES: DUF3619 family protein [unclassified Janthinobacterium]MEC5159351.1 hypothetical protein [Janthinobacterium sp. CG_S6]
MNTEDLNFAYKVRHALNEKLDNLPPSTSERLAAARAQAMARKKAHAPAPLAHSVAAGTIGRFFSQPFALLGRMSLVLPLLAMGAGVVGIYQYEQDQQIAELAELDAEVLSDELPLSAYLDHGFNAYLTTKREQ